MSFNDSMEVVGFSEKTLDSILNNKQSLINSLTTSSNWNVCELFVLQSAL